MIQKIKRPVSILLALLMVVGMFSVLPISAGAVVWTDNSIGEWQLSPDDIIHMESDSVEFVSFSVVLKGGTYKVAGTGEVAQSDIQFGEGWSGSDGTTLDPDGFHHNGTTYVPVDAKGYQSGSWLALDVNYDTGIMTFRGMSDYYLVGTMNEWNTDDVTYELAKNPGNTDEYMLLDFAADANTEFKVVSAGNYIAPTNNFTLNDAGTYDIYFRPDGSGNQADGWVEGKVFANNFRPASSATYVAAIGTAQYETLEAAFAAANDGDTITLLANCAGNGIKVTPAGKFVNGLTVDFAGFTYTVDGETVGSTGTETNGFQLLKDNKVTFKNGTITSAKAKILVQNYSDLTLDGMTLTLNNPNYTGAYTLSDNNGDVVIDDTTINANPAGGYAFDVCRFSSYPSVHVTVTGNSVIDGDVEISASKGDAKEGFSLTLESGSMTGEIVVDASAKALVGENNKITKADGFDKEAPADFKWVSNGDGTSKLVAKKYVAQVGTAKYETLDAAIAAAQAGDTVTLLADIALPAQSISGESSTYGAYITKSLTIDGDGHTVTSTAPRAFGVKGTQGDIDVTFKNITVTDKEQGAICVCTRGGINSLTLDNATLSTQGATKGYIQPLTIGGSQASKATVTVKNNSVIQTGDAAGKHYAIILWNPVDLTIQDSTIKGWACVYQKPFEDASAGVKTEVTIDNSTLMSTGIKGSTNHFATIFTENADFTCKITNTTIDITAAADTYQAVAASNNSASGFKVELGEGNNVTLTGDTALIGFNFDDENHEIAVSGGTFNKPVAEYYCAEGFIPATLDEQTGTYSVKTGAYVAQVNGVKYETLEAAFAAAQDGNTITLLADCTGNGIKAPQGKFATGLTVDFGGHTYTVDGATVGSTGTETNGFQLLKDNNITFRNGTITSAKAKILVQNYSNLTLDGMTLTLNNTGYNGAYTLSDNNGNVVINNTTINANPTTGSFAFDVCRYSSYPSVNVTVTSNSTINGDVEISASKGDAKEGFSLTLESGTMTGNIVVDNSAKNLINNGGTVNKAAAFNKAAPEGFVWVDSATTGVQTLAKAVAKIGTTNYATLEAAFAAAQDGDTITVLADSAGNGIKVAQGKFATGLTVDFDGHTYTVNANTVGSTGTETQGFQLLKDNKITFKNGTINGDTTATATLLFLIQNYSNLTLDNMNLELVGKFYNQYTLSNNNGNIVINDSTINAPTYGGVVRHDVNSYAFDVCRFSSYPSVNVTVTGSSTINGDVEISASGSNARDGFSLTLESGTMNGNIVIADNAKSLIDNGGNVTKKDTFTKEAPADFKWVADGEGTSKLVPKEYVAQVGDTKYETLEEAIEAVAADGTVKLLQNISMTGADWIVIDANKAFTLDLDGKTISSEDSVFVIRAGSDVTVTNGSLVSTVANDYVVYNDGTFTLAADASITDSNAAGNGIIARTGSTTNIYGTVTTGYYSVAVFGTAVANVYDGAAITSTDASCLSGNGSNGNEGYTMNVYGGTLTSTNDVAIYHPNQGDLNITGGTITGATAIYIKSGSTDIATSGTSITGATIVGNGAETPFTHSNNGCIATGDAVVIENCGYPGGTPAIGISGGTFTSTNGKAVATYATEGYEEIGKFVSGGTFSSEVPEEYCAIGYVPKDNGDGTYGVTPAELFNGYSISTDGDIHLNFFIDKNAIPNFDTASSVVVKFTWDSGTEEGGIDDFSEVNLKTADTQYGYLKAKCTVNAAQMACPITATVYVNGTVIGSDTYSVKDYAEDMLGNQDYAEYHEFLKAMLNYGGYAQKVFVGETDSRVPNAGENVNVDMSGIDSTTIRNAIKGGTGASIDDLKEIGEQIGGKWYTTSVIFLSKNTIRHYFDDVNEKGIFDGTNMGETSSPYIRYVEKSDIAPDQLDTLYTFTVKGKSFEYSVLNYAADILQYNTNTDAQNLAKALYLYNQAANELFAH